MNYRQMKSIIEGLLFISGDDGLSVAQIADVLEQTPAAVKEVLADLEADFSREGRGLKIVQLAGMYQICTLPEHAPYFQRLARTPTRSTLSQAALETLAIIAYRQPITRIGIEEIRGVKSDRALHTLIAKELAHEVGRSEAIGRPILYGTTTMFLDYFGLRSLDDLPESNALRFDTNLEEETRMLFEELDGRQLTMNESGDT